jgi:4-hydroxy-L-threonine phosphate dehydrogenase PdxA
MARAAIDHGDAFDQAWQQGRDMSLNEAIALAFGETIVKR